MYDERNKSVETIVVGSTHLEPTSATHLQNLSTLPTINQGTTGQSQLLGMKGEKYLKLGDLDLAHFM